MAKNLKMNIYIYVYVYIYIIKLNYFTVYKKQTL